MNMYYSAAAATNIGNVRSNNEDNFCFDGSCLNANDNVQSMILRIEGSNANAAFAVFDGMGGESCGEKASEAAAKSFRTYFKNMEKIKTEELLQKKLLKFYSRANKKVQWLSRKLKATSGTTAVTIMVMDNKIYISNIGDSKAYRFRGGIIEQLSEDHTMAELMVKSGAMSREEANKSRGRNSLTRFIGANSEDYDLSPHCCAPIGVCAGDFYLLCTDGLSDLITEAEFISVLSNRDSSCAEKTEELINSAMQHGGKDNCTLILVSFFSKVY